MKGFCSKVKSILSQKENQENSSSLILKTKLFCKKTYHCSFADQMKFVVYNLTVDTTKATTNDHIFFERSIQ
jgi:hypothetical protein